MSDKVRVPLTEARSLACQLLDMLGPFTDQIQIAGSIRRWKPDIGDIELVMAPRIEEREVGLLGDMEPTNLLFEELTRLRAAGVLVDRVDKNGRGAFGERMQRVLYKEFPVDLFSVLPPAQWGVILTIRTGPAEFSHGLVTPQVQGGRMPMGMRVQDGQLIDRGAVIPTPTERSFFDAIGLRYIEPEDRTDECVAALG